MVSYELGILLWKRILFCFIVYTGVKVVSVSRTPGHTKHFQTIFLTSTVRLCDSPGLVFPSAVARPLQVYTDSVLIFDARRSACSYCSSVD